MPCPFVIVIYYFLASNLCVLHQDDVCTLMRDLIELNTTAIKVKYIIVNILQQLHLLLVSRQISFH